MLRKIAWVFAALILFVGTYVAYLMMTTKNHSPAAVEEFTSGDLTIQVKYSQPYKKGRLIFGNESEDALVPYGKKWRTGANEATEISFSADVKMGAEVLKGGRYSLYTIPGAENWTIVFNSKLEYWGAKIGGDPFEEEFDVVRVPASVTEVDTDVEQFTISFTPSDSGVNMNFYWDKARVTLPIERAQ
jgi:hypothetical protein